MRAFLVVILVLSLALTGCGVAEALKDGAVFVGDLLFGTAPSVDAEGNATPGSGGLLGMLGIGGAGAVAAVWQHLRGRNWKGAALATAAGVEDYMRSMSAEEQRKLAAKLSSWQEGEGGGVREFVSSKVLPAAKSLLSAEVGKA